MSPAGCLSFIVGQYQKMTENAAIVAVGIVLVVFHRRLGRLLFAVHQAQARIPARVEGYEVIVGALDACFIVLWTILILLSL